MDFNGKQKDIWILDIQTNRLLIDHIQMSKTIIQICPTSKKTFYQKISLRGSAPRDPYHFFSFEIFVQRDAETR